jgi:hydrogenase nickel incorporation protein HypB
MKIDINKDVYAAEKTMAQINRETFVGYALPVVNMIGSPGSGKTTLLEATLAFMKAQGKRIGVIEGDVETSLDSERLEGFGMPVRLVNTNGGCHLSPANIHAAAKALPLDQLDLLIIENVGNLVCPAAFDLGERLKLAVLSTPEGDEKPLKYPALFKNAQLTVITKAELADACRFDIERATANIRSINPDAMVIPLSVFENVNMDVFYQYLLDLIKLIIYT